MKNTVKNTFYVSMWLVLISLNSVNAAIDYSGGWVNQGLVWSTNTIDVVLQNWLAYLTWFLYFIAIAMMIWGGFNIITAWWEEEKVKKWKTILMQAAGWLIVIFLANSLISWIIDLLFAQA